MRMFEILGIVLFLALFYVAVAIIVSLFQLHAAAAGVVTETTLTMGVGR